MSVLKAIFVAVLVGGISNCDSTSFTAKLFGKKHPIANEQDIIDVYQCALPCVAALEVQHLVKPNRRQRLAGLFRKRRYRTVAVSQASGLLWDDQGHIVTNNHCYYSDGREALRVKVKLPGICYHVNAELVGSDLLQDIAVLEIVHADLEQLKDESIQHPKPLNVGSSRSLQVGQTVLAIGSPHGRSGTLANGVVTSLDRDINHSLGFTTHGCIETNGTYSAQTVMARLHFGNMDVCVRDD